MPSLRTHVSGATFVLTLEHPPRNVLDQATVQDLAAALRPLAGRRDLASVVLQSALPGVFSAGVDVADHVAERVEGMLASFHEVFRILDRLPQVTVAAVDGLCLGGACELACFCDFVIATPRSTFAQPEIDLGCFPPVAAAAFPRLVGRAAFDLVLTGRRLDAAEARAAGLVTAVAEDVAAEVGRLTGLLASKSRVALGAARRALRASLSGELDAALERAERLYRAEVAPSADAAEGVRAFFEKRAPRWSHS
jgi:cyclohexa-1,5-dienecarbonyl-CoA hydratase